MARHTDPNNDPGNFELAAGQNSLTGLWPVGGFGQRASFFIIELNPAPLFIIGDPLTTGPWDAKLLLAHGTYSGPATGPSIDDSINAFTAFVWRNDDLSLIDGPVQGTIAEAKKVVIPEPATLSLVLLSLAGVVMPRRSRA